MDRDVFLGRVGRAVMSARLPEPPAVAPGLPSLPEADLLALFRERAQEVDAVVHGPMSPHAAPKSIAGIASGHHARNFICWDDPGAPGIISALSSAGLDRLDHEVPGPGRIEHQVGYRRLELGVTGADAGLAESGSVVLVHGPTRPRMASLAPETHVAVLEVSKVHRSLAHWAQMHPDIVEQTANLVVVTGPSRTGDIEQQLNPGVHGPRHLHLVLVR